MMISIAREFTLFAYTILTFLLLTTVVSSTSCNRSCHKKHLPYPFGFSEGCPIRLNCTDNSVRIGEFEVQIVTSETISVRLPPKCNRSIESIAPLFHQNYVPTWRNGLLLHNCSTTTSFNSCVIPRALLKTQFSPDERCDRAYCLSKEKEMKQGSVGDLYMAFDNVSQSGCKFLYSSVAMVLDSVNKNDPTLEFQTVELAWWLEGNCSSCAPNANCTKIVSPVNGKPSFQCSCLEGYKGDGFLAGNGCQKGSSGVGSSGTMRAKIIYGGLSGVGALVLIIMLVVYWRSNKTRQDTNVEVFLENYGRLTLHRYSYSSIKKITNCFKDKIGQGGYGGVFKGKLSDGRFIAVKVLTESKGNGEDFINEVATIGRTNHVNIVSLIGFCIRGPKRALVYEYMPNGSLEKYIYNEKNTSAPNPLGCERLYEIALGIANGLEYLHCGCNTRILHFDIKPHNILLDKDFVPKISDFGLAKLCPTKDSVVSMLGTRGTVGYIAPEVYCRNFGGVSHKSDVYSYGMLVLEMVGGRKNIDVTAENISEIYFPQWIYNRLEQHGSIGLGGFKEMFKEESIKKMIIIGLWCIQTHPSNRPSVSMVVEMLQKRVEDLQMPPDPFKDPTTSSQPTS